MSVVWGREKLKLFTRFQKLDKLESKEASVMMEIIASLQESLTYPLGTVDTVPRTHKTFWGGAHKNVFPLF